MSRDLLSPRARRAAVAAAVLAVLAPAAGCGSPDHAAQPVTQPVTQPGTQPGTQAGALPAVLDFTAKTVGGDVFEGSSVAGRKTVFWFWAPNCMDCAREAPHLLAAERAFHNAVRFVGVPGLGDPASMKTAIAQLKIGGFTQVADPDGAIWKRFGVVTQPAYAFVDAAGHVEVVKGALGAKGISAHVIALAAA